MIQVDVVHQRMSNDVATFGSAFALLSSAPNVSRRVPKRDAAFVLLPTVRYWTVLRLVVTFDE